MAQIKKYKKREHVSLFGYNEVVTIKKPQINMSQINIAVKFNELPALS